MIDWLIGTIKVIISIFAAIIGLIHIIISPPSEEEVIESQIDYIESKIEIDLPEEYENVNRFEDWFGFDYSEEVTIYYSEAEFEKLLIQIKDDPNWEYKENVYTYKDFTKDYHIESRLDPNIYTFEFNFYDL